MMHKSEYSTYINGKWERILPFEDCIKSIEVRNAHQLQEIERLQKKLSEFDIEVYKDKELQQMSERYNKMKKEYYQGFPISDEEKEITVNFQKHHSHSRTFHFTFTPTGIGTVGEIVCPVCGEKEIFQSIK